MSGPMLETERLILRQWRESDLDAFADMMSHEDVSKYLTLGGVPLDRAGSWGAMAVYAGHWALKGYGLFVVEEKRSGAFIGRVGAWQPDGWFRFEIGWALHRAHWGKGFAIEAARASAAWAFERFDLDRIVSVIHVDNARSSHLAGRLGMHAARRIEHVGMPHLVWTAARDDFRRGLAHRAVTAANLATIPLLPAA